MIQAVIFDRDGVLIDSEYTNVRAAELAFGELGITPTEQEKDWIVGRHPDDYLVPLRSKYVFDYEKYRELQRERYSELFQNTPIFEKTIELLKSIHTKGVPLAICTSSNIKSTLQLLERTGIRNLFQQIVTKDDYLKRKPNPDPYLVTAQKLGLKPENCLVIEDSEVGLESALRAGMKCVVIFNEHTKHQNFTGALKVVDSAENINLEEMLSY